MEETVKVKKFKLPNAKFTSILWVVLGLVLLIQPGSSLDFICRILGVIILAAGIIEIVVGLLGKASLPGASNTVVGAIVVVLGLLILIRPDILVSVLPFVAGIIITINGISSLVRSLQLIGAKDRFWWIGLIFSIVAICFGLLLFFKSYEAAEFTARIVGIFLIYTGVSRFWIAYRRDRAARIRKQEEAALDVEATIVDEE